MLTSIVMLTRNQLDQTMRCLRSIRMFTDAPYELIAVDNGSTDGTVAWLAAQPDVRLIVNRDNRGFAAASNQGAAAAGGEHVLLLNNDTVVTPRWLSLLLAALYEDGGAAIAGPMSNYVMRMQMIGTPIVGSDDEIRRFGEAYNRRRPDKRRETSAISGFCMLVRRSVWLQLGGLDEDYAIGGYEDIDFGYRALRAGHTLRIAGDTFVYHEGNRSFNGNELNVYAIAGANRRLFLRKWGFNPDRLHWRLDPAFLPGAYAPGHPHHAPRSQELPGGWYAQGAGGSVYRIERGSKRPVVSLDTLRRLRVDADRIAPTSEALLQTMPTGDPIDTSGAFPTAFPDIFVALAPDRSMHLVAYGIRYPIGSENTFAALGLRWDEAVSITGVQYHALCMGWPIGEQVWDDYELPDYRLYRGPDGGLYYSEGQRLRAVPDTAALVRYGLRAEDATMLPVEVFVRTPRGFGLPG